jgi:TonB family protein
MNRIRLLRLLLVALIVGAVFAMTEIRTPRVGIQDEPELLRSQRSEPAAQKLPGVSRHINPPTVVKDAVPVYPAAAKTAGIQGTVIIEVVIGPDGIVQDVRVLRSIPQLDQAAVEAARRLEFTPTTLPNGSAVPVILTLPVRFTLEPTPSAVIDHRPPPVRVG